MAQLISIGEIFDRTIDHYRKHFTPLVSISAWILVAAVPAALSKLLAPFTDGPEIGLIDWLVVSLNIIGGLLLIIVSAWALIAIILSIADQTNGSPTNPTHHSKEAKKLILPYVWVSILVGLVMFAVVSAPFTGLILILLDAVKEQATVLSSIGAILIILGGVVSLFLLIKYSIELGFAPYSLVLENARGTKALRHSSLLIKNRWWATSIRFIIPKVLYALIVFIVNYSIFQALAILILFTLGEGPLGIGIGNALWFLITATTTALVTPLLAITDYHIYDSLRKTRTRT